MTAGTAAKTVKLTLAQARQLAERALAAAGAGAETARVMADALVRAEAEGLHGIGLGHLDTYCEGLRLGRIDGHAEPLIERPTPALVRADARGGVGHVGFERAFDGLVEAARALGIALFSQRNSYTNAALDWFVWRLAEEELVGFAATNGGPPLLAASGSTRPVFCTNPMAFAAPRAGGPPLVIDQSSSATAFVNLRHAAAAGKAIPEGWALDGEGRPTTDAMAALRGVLLPFGGARGANVALMVEVLAAGLSGANWSLDAPSFLEGAHSPGIGLCVVAIAPDLVLGADFARRLEAYLARLETEFGVYLPGRRRAKALAAARRGGILLDGELHAAITALAERQDAAGRLS